MYQGGAVYKDFIAVRKSCSSPPVLVAVLPKRISSSRFFGLKGSGNSIDKVEASYQASPHDMG